MSGKRQWVGESLGPLAKRPSNVGAGKAPDRAPSALIDSQLEDFDLDMDDVDERLLEEELELELGVAGRNWKRPKATLDCASKPLSKLSRVPLQHP